MMGQGAGVEVGGFDDDGLPLVEGVLAPGEVVDVLDDVDGVGAGRGPVSVGVTPVA
jgi:hypothetical protein